MRWMERTEEEAGGKRATVEVMILVALVLFLLPEALVYAAPLVVTNLNDSGPGSLRQTIATAGPTDVIEFSVTGTIVLTTGELLVDKNLVINGPGADQVTISGNNTSRVFHITAGDVEISGLTIANGIAEEAGGGVYLLYPGTEGKLTIRKSVVRDCSTNLADPFYFGGGVTVLGEVELFLIDSSVLNNSAGQGGGIYSGWGATVTNTTVRGNKASSGGGAVLGGNVSVTRSNVIGNSAAEGAGLFLVPISSRRTFNVTNTTVSGNTIVEGSVGSGGGILSRGNLTLINSTLSNNSVPFRGGGIANGGTLRVIHSTISNNNAQAGGGVRSDGANSTVELTNTILASNTGGDCSTQTQVSSLGHNLDSDGTCVLTGTGDLSNANPMLAPLADYAGPTFTRALLSGSPAINHVPAASCELTTDQRGAARPQGLGCDIGSYEAGVPCTSLVDASYVGASSMLNLGLTVGAVQPGITWNLWLSLQNTTTRWWSIPIPVVDPPIRLKIPLAGFPNAGSIGFLSTMTTTGGGIVCSEWKTVDTTP